MDMLRPPALMVSDLKAPPRLGLAPREARGNRHQRRAAAALARHERKGRPVPA